MFTGKLFEIEDFADLAELAICNSFSFSYAGKIDTALAPRVVACRSGEYLQRALITSGVAGVIIPPSLRGLVPPSIGAAVAEDPIRSLNTIQAYLAKEDSGQWSRFESRIHDSVVRFPGCYVAPYDVIIEECVTLYPNSVIMPRTIIGARSSIGAGTVVGTDAFEVDMTAEPRCILAQSGGVRIGSNVDIQAGCTIVRATFGGFTELADETKLDCQVHFAHDCRAGRRVRIAACAELSGRVSIGDDSFIGPNAAIVNGAEIGTNAHVSIGAVVTRNVVDDSQVTGNFALDHDKWLKFVRSIR